MSSTSPLSTGPKAPVLVHLDPSKRLGRLEPLLHGHFIEHLGRSIDGGIFEPGSPLADERGFRRDVLAKVKELQPRLLRWPGGTYTKIYHWQDGVGPQAGRRRRPNLIWGGVESHAFGTNEFILYCRAIGAEPYISVNMGTGTAEEAAAWVEYCNGTGDTEYANLRRAHGFPAPHGVKFWGLGNEEEAEPDAGVLQDPQAYAKAAWQFAKLIKLQDPSVQIIAAGVARNPVWNRTVLDSLHPVADYLSAHWYFKPGDYPGLLASVAAFDRELAEFTRFLAVYPEQPEFSPWYRFPPRRQGVRLAVDEWGLWSGSGTRENMWDLYKSYTWQDALGVASWLNAFQRHPGVVGLANWAQLTNVIAPIQTSPTASVRQTVFAVLALFADAAGEEALHVELDSPKLENSDLAQVDASATRREADGRLSLFLVNRHATAAITVRLPATAGRVAVVELTAPALGSVNTIERPEEDCVQRKVGWLTETPDLVLAPASVTLLRFFGPSVSA